MSTSIGSQENLFYHQGQVDKDYRKSCLNMKGCTVWLTGLSASGKSTIAVALEHYLVTKYRIPCYRLDGDNVRLGLNSDLGFSAADRAENIRRIGEVSKLFADSGMICISSFISPYRQGRDQARLIHDKSGLAFVEVFADAPLHVVEERDPKGLYKKARQGLIKQFTGIDDPYEEPADAQVHLRTDQMSIDICVERIVEYLKQNNIIPTNS